MAKLRWNANPVLLLATAELVTRKMAAQLEKQFRSLELCPTKVEHFVKARN